MMNWLQKAAQSQEEQVLDDPSLWKPRQKAILSTFGYKDFSVVSIIDWDQIGELSTHYKIKGDVVTSPNQFGSMTWHRNEGSIPCMILDTYGTAYKDHYIPGSVIIVNPTNLYKTLGDLITKEVRVVYPDVLQQVFNSEHISDFLHDYPDMKGFSSMDQFVQYEQFQDQSDYVIQIFRDPRAYKGWGQQEAEFPYYWFIPELKVRSLDFNTLVHGKLEMQELLKLIWSRSGSFRYHTVQEAADAASKYLDYTLYSSPVE